MEQSMERKRGLLFIKPDSLENGQLLKYEVMHYLQKKGCRFDRMRYLVLTKEFLELHYADLKEGRPAIYQDMVNLLEGQIVTAIDVELPLTYNEQGQCVPMTCEEFRETIIGPTFVSFDAIQEKTIKDAKKHHEDISKEDLYVRAYQNYAKAQKTMRGIMTNQLEGVDPETMKTLNTVHYSASKAEADLELERVFEDTFEGNFKGKVASRIIYEPEITEILNLTNPVSSSPTRKQYEHFRFAFENYKKDMELVGAKISNTFLVERFCRLLQDKRFENPSFMGDKNYLTFTKDMLQLQKELTTYYANRNVLPYQEVENN